MILYNLPPELFKKQNGTDRSTLDLSKILSANAAGLQIFRYTLRREKNVRGAQTPERKVVVCKLAV